MIKNVLITVLDSLNYTTMPYNEFVLYRSEKFLEEQQIVLLTGNDILIPSCELAPQLVIYKVGKNPIVIRKALKQIISDCRHRNIGWVLHMHSIRGSFSTAIAMFGIMNYKCSVYTIHSTFTGYKIHNKILSFLDAVFANYVTCVSETSYSKFPNIVKVIKKNRILPILNGVNISRVDNDISSINTSKEDDVFRIVYVARLIGLKNHMFLVDVAKKIKDNNVNGIKFVFVGKEEDFGKTREYVEQLGVLHMFEFTGLIPRKDVYKQLINSDLYVSSSTLEGLPISVLEGMYCRLPAILSSIPQHIEVSKGCDAVSVLPFDTEKWFYCIMKYKNMTTDEILSKGECCKEHVKRYFTLTSMHEKYNRIYDNIRMY